MAVHYYANYQYYLVVDGFKFEEATGATQVLELSAGYNWISTYIEVEDPEAMIATLEEGLGENGVSIESMEGMLEYIGMWFGDEFGMTNETMYIVEVSEDCSVELTGAPADPAVHPITIEPEGWNWIGYPVSEEMEVNDALSGFEAEMGDMIESDKDGIVEYVGTWYGDFDTMVPGQGYQYYSASGEERTLVFSSGTKARRAQGSAMLKVKDFRKAVSDGKTRKQAKVVVKTEKK